MLEPFHFQERIYLDAITGEKAARLMPRRGRHHGANAASYECAARDAGQRFFMIDLRRTLIGALAPSRSL
jgi:hypothetical protein